MVFHGDLRRSEVRRIVRGLDVLVHATHSESFGIAVVEGMLAARPVVVTDTAGLRQAVADGKTGLLVPEADDESLAKALARLAGAPALARRLGLSAQVFARERFSDKSMAAAYEGLVWFKVQQSVDNVLRRRGRGISGRS